MALRDSSWSSLCGSHKYSIFIIIDSRGVLLFKFFTWFVAFAFISSEFLKIVNIWPVIRAAVLGWLHCTVLQEGEFAALYKLSLVLEYFVIMIQSTSIELLTPLYTVDRIIGRYCTSQTTDFAHFYLFGLNSIMQKTASQSGWSIRFLAFIFIFLSLYLWCRKLITLKHCVFVAFVGSISRAPDVVVSLSRKLFW